MINIMKQSSFIASINNAEKSKKEVDIYIEPYLSDRNAADFDNGTINIKRGYIAANKNLNELINLKNYLSKFPQKKNSRLIKIDTLYASEHIIDFSDSNKRLSTIINKNFNHIENNKINTQDIKNSIHYLYGTRLFKKLTYDFLPSKKDSGVTIKYNIVKEKDKQLLLSLQYKTETKMGINIGFRYRNLIIPGSKLVIKFRVSENPGAKVNLFSYLNSNIRNGIDATYFYRTSKIPFYESKTLIAEYSSHFHRWSSAYHHFANEFSDFSVGFAHERIYYTKIIDVSEYSYPKIINLNYYLNIAYKRNTKNKKYFTSKGSFLNINSKLFINNISTYYLPKDSTVNPEMIEYEVDSSGVALTVMFNYKYFKPISSKFVLLNEIDAFAGLGYIYNIWVGGVNPDIDYQLSFWGMPENSRMEANGWVYRIGLRYNLFNKVYLTSKLNCGFFAEDLLNIFLSPEDDYGKYSSIFNYENYAIGGGLELSYQSVIGPISVSVTRSSESYAFWWHLLIGYSF
jgi:NTE family protein